MAELADRYVVRELEGFTIQPNGPRRTGGKSRPGLTVWVADEAMYGLEVRVWRSEDHQGMYRARLHGLMRGEASELAHCLNESEARAP